GWRRIGRSRRSFLFFNLGFRRCFNAIIEPGVETIGNNLFAGSFEFFRSWFWGSFVNLQIFFQRFDWGVIVCNGRGRSLISFGSRLLSFPENAINFSPND
ncbi:MAG TPA: hypothetical protein DD473_01305, partial [Planctomycetaceae bacterium]|nr:hypothetical protein [Planctomycetaceae bacterium]